MCECAEVGEEDRRSVRPTKLFTDPQTKISAITFRSLFRDQKEAIFPLYLPVFESGSVGSPPPQRKSLRGFEYPALADSSGVKNSI